MQVTTDLAEAGAEGSGEEEAEARQGVGEETAGEDVSAPREPQGVGTRAFTSAKAWR